ncbi:hypothetical protein [Shinella sp. M27]|uniref:hypothetical protein n=1 Tax=Shinella sp. M27 TaxID=3368614 RepID=UPI003BA1335E
MTDTATKTAIVERGVKAQALGDKYLAAALKQANAYAKVVEDAVKNGFFTDALEAKRMLAQARTVAGQIAAAAESLAELHQSGTQLAIDNEVDLGSVSTVGGVPFVKRTGGVVVFGGGGR